MALFQQCILIAVFLSHMGHIVCQKNSDPLPKGLEECLQLISLRSQPFNKTDQNMYDFNSIETQSTCLQEFVWKFGGINWADFNITEHDIKFINSLTHSLVEEHNRFRRQPEPTTRRLIRPRTGFRVRKEYRRLSDRDRNAFHAAINVMKKRGQYNTFANLHRGTVITTAHRGPNFFGWHRVYLALVEEALRRINRRVALPYWDSSLDYDMDNPVNSIMWSTAFLGNGDGFVTSGPFANWQTPIGRLTRNIGGASRLISKEAIGRVLTRCRTSQISDPSALPDFNLEFIHGGPHVWVGGQMSGLNTAAHDPAFFLLHSFIDYIWEQFRIRQAKRCRVNPETDYPPSVTMHESNRVMDGFRQYRNIDGYRNYWTRSWYRYERSPRCSRTNRKCGTPYLRCDAARRRCISVARRIPISGTSGATRMASGAPTASAANRARTQEATLNIGPKFAAPSSDGRTANVGFAGRQKRAVNQTIPILGGKGVTFGKPFLAPPSDGRTSDALGFNIASGVPSSDPVIPAVPEDGESIFPFSIPMPLLPTPDFIGVAGNQSRVILLDTIALENIPFGDEISYIP